MWRDVFMIESCPATSDPVLIKVLQTADLSVGRRSPWSSFSLEAAVGAGGAVS